MSNQKQEVISGAVQLAAMMKGEAVMMLYAASHLSHDVAHHSLLAVPAAELVSQLGAARVAHHHLDHSLLLLVGWRGRGGHSSSSSSSSSS
jgi:hypothetical protein